MTYYDHATAMAFELDRWRKHRDLRTHEYEAILAAQRMPAQIVKKRSKFRQCLNALRSIRFTDVLDTP